MNQFEDLHPDCRHFRWDRPCAPHKREGVTCPGCSHYDAVARRLVVVKLAAVGDVLRTTSLLPAMHKRYPGASITWVTTPSAVGLFDGNPLVDAVWTPDDPRLRVEEFDVALCPDADPVTVAHASAVRARQRVGFTMEKDGRVHATNEDAVHWFRMGLDDSRKKANTETYQSLVAKVLALDPADVEEPILVPSAADREFVAAFRKEHGMDGKIVGVNTGAGPRWERKAWDTEHQRELIATLASQGVHVLLLGGPEEAGTHDRLIPPSSRGVVVTAGTGHSYTRFGAFVGMCDVLVTGDTLALHVAGAQKVPVAALFGPTSVAEIEVYGRGEKIAPEGLDCLGCYLPTCDVTPHCQTRITPAMVLASVERLLGSRVG